MKKTELKVFWVLLTILGISIQSCLRDQCVEEQTFFRYDPIYRTLTQIRNSLQIKEPEELVSPGKIYVYDQYLFIGEQKKGIHIYDNSDPHHPLQISFISIEGNQEFAIQNDVLYADNYIDIVALDVSDPRSPKFICRRENVYNPFSVDPARGILVDYLKTPETVKMNCNNNNFYRDYFWEGDILYNKRGGPTTVTNSGGSNINIGGSTSRFTVSNNFLYTVDNATLSSFEMINRCLDLRSGQNIGWNIETIWALKDKLFVGSQTGMLIFDIKSPSNPVSLGSYNHVRRCDPVVADEKYAYVTLKGGTTCGGFTNQLDILDISNLLSPNLILTYPLVSPVGLSIDGDVLYVCDDAVKILNVKDRAKVILISKIAVANTKDVIAIPGEEHIIIVGDNGVDQYDVTDKSNPQKLSSITIQH
ncbi:MAG: hypothetical protein U0V49_03425 [Saprospiraceae bacterium]